MQDFEAANMKVNGTLSCFIQMFHLQLVGIGFVATTCFFQTTNIRFLGGSPQDFLFYKGFQTFYQGFLTFSNHFIGCRWE